VITKFKNIGLIDLLALIFLFVLVFSRGTMAGDPGVGWHLLTGKEVVESSHVPTTDFILFTTADKTWVANQWLSDVIFFKALETGGWPLLHLLAITLALLPVFYLLYPLLRQEKISSFVIAISILIFALVSSVQWILRPVLFSFLLFSLTYSILHRRYCSTSDSSAKTFVYLMPIIFALWVNLHPGFVLGIALLFFYLLATIINFLKGNALRRDVLLLSVATALSLIACLANPYSWQIFYYIKKLAISDYFMNLNVEWLSADLHHSLLQPFGFSVVLLLLLISRQNKNSIRYAETILLLVFLFLSLMHRRYLPFFGVVSLLPIARALQQFFVANANDRPTLWQASVARIDSRMRDRSNFLYSGLAYAGILVFVLVKGTLPGKSQSYSSFPENFPLQALEVVKASPLNARIFHSPNWGGFISYNLAPQKVAFIDDRNELNGEALYEDFFAANMGLGNWQQIFTNYNFTYALLEPGSPLAYYLSSSSDWSKVFEDEKSLLFARDKELVFFE